MISVTNLFESKPVNPESVVIINQFYPNGLTEQQVYDYYIRNKDNILDQVKNRELMFFIATDVNKLIVRRKTSDRFFQLNSKNYEQVLHGRVISIHSTMNETESFGIIDIDYHIFDECKEAAAQVYDFLFKINRNIQIRYTGKQSFHLIYNFDKKMNINDIREVLKNLLLPLSDSFIIGGRRSENKINLDLSSNKFRGGFITLHSLSVIGLRCMEVDRKQIDKFKQKDALIF